MTPMPGNNSSAPAKRDGPRTVLVAVTIHPHGIVVQGSKGNPGLAPPDDNAELGRLVLEVAQDPQQPAHTVDQETPWGSVFRGAIKFLSDLGEEEAAPKP